MGGDGGIEDLTCMIQKFSHTTKDQLKYYVYLLKHPKTGKIFYVGKGIGDRIFNHAKAALKEKQGKNLKLKLIRSFKKLGGPKYEILRHGLSEKEAFEVEAATIDLCGLDELKIELSNEQKGHGTYRGRMSINQVMIRYEPKDAPRIEAKAILININKNFLPDKDWQFYYEAVKGRWVLYKERAEQAEYVFAVYKGVVYAIVKVDQDSWHKEFRLSEERFKKKKAGWAFTGRRANALVEDKYLHKFVGMHTQMPIRYTYIQGRKLRP